MGVFRAPALLVVADGFRPDGYDLGGAALGLVGASVIVPAPRPA